MSNLRKEIELMLELDRLDQRIMERKEYYKDIPQKRSRLNSEIEEAKIAMASEKEHYEEQKLEIDYLKDELKILDNKIVEIEGKFKESNDDNDFSILQKEKKLRMIKNEELISGETLLKDTEDVVKEYEDKFKEIKDKNEKLLEEIASDEKNFIDEIKENESKKSKIFKKLDTLDLTIDITGIYQQISEAFPGGVVAKVENDSCSRCFMQITPQLLNDLHRESYPDSQTGRIITCPSCSCILYIDPDENN